MPIQWIIWGALVVIAILLTLRFNKSDTPVWKVLKFFGVLISTMPIIGIAQGLVAMDKSKGYSEACFYQAAAGVVAYLLMKNVFHVIG